MRLDRGDAVLLVDWTALEIARVDMSDTGDAGAARIRIQIGVEHAAGACELQFGAVAFANLQPGLTEVLAKLIGRHSIQG